MGQGNSLSATSLHQSLRSNFKTFPEHRDPLRLEIPMDDALMSGFSTFSMKLPSLLQFEEEMLKQTGISSSFMPNG